MSDAFMVTLPQLVAVAGGAAGVGMAVLFLWLRRPRLRLGRRCPRCLRPWRSSIEDSWGALERQARREAAARGGASRWS